ncbi:DUF4249 domain-containing protein [Spirosoma koreense]
MQSSLKILALVLLIGLSYHCRPVITDPASHASVVVEAYLYPGKPVRVKLKKAVSYDSNKNNEEPLDGLTLTFSNQQHAQLMKSVGTGTYTLTEPFLIKTGESYTLNFTYADQLIAAETTIPEAPEKFSQSVDSVLLKPITITDKLGDQLTNNTSIRLSWSNPNNAYYYVAVYNVEKHPVPIVTAPTGQNINPFVFSSKPTMTNTIEINMAQFQYFGLHQLILFRVNADYAKLYNSGFSNQSSLVNIPTSSVHNGLGLFTGLSSDTLLFRVVRK